MTNLLRVCTQEKNCKVMEIKGLSESYIKNNHHGQLFDADGNKKAAYFEMLQYMLDGYYTE
jgi:hypothetical protein